MAESIGKKYEKYIMQFFEKWGNSLSIVNTMGTLDWVNTQHSIVGASGVVWAFDVAFVVKDPSGQEYKFLVETKNYTTSKLTPGEVAELAGKIADLDEIAGVFLVTSNDLSENSEKFASAKGFEYWTIPFNEGDTGYLLVNKKMNVYQFFDEEIYDTPNRVKEECEAFITYSDGRTERLKL